MIDKQTMDNVHILYICSYGQTGLPICVDLEHRYCKLKSQKSKKCNLRPVVSYKDYKRKEQECEELKKQIELMMDCASCKVDELDQLKAKGQAEQKLERITNILFTGQCSNCEGYSPNCSNKELCDFKHNIKNIIDEVEDA